MKTKQTKRIMSVILVTVMVFIMMPLYSLTASAEESFSINNTVYTETDIKNIPYSSCYSLCGHNLGESGHVCCVRKSKEAYKFFWGQECTNNFKVDDLLYGSSNIPITVENVEKYLKAADPGAIVYFVRENDTSYGHAFLLLKINSTGKGAWILNCNYDSKGSCAVQNKTWSEIVDLKNYTNASILYYIQFPGGASCKDRLEKPTGTTKTVTELMQIFPDGKYWNHLAKSGHGYSNGTRHYENTECGDVENTYTSTPCANHTSAASIGQYDCNSFDGAIQCAGFARKLAQLAYGESSVKTNWSSVMDNSTALQVIKPGDVLHYFASNTDQKNGHWVFVIGVSGSIITVGECNWGAERPKSNCLIKWGRSFDLKSATKLTLYRAPYALSGGAENTSNYYSTIESDIYYLKNKSTGTYMTTDGIIDPSNVSVKVFNGENVQKFVLEGSDKSYTLSTSFDTSIRLNPYSDTNGANVNVHSSQYESGNDQHWGFEAVTGGYIIHNMKDQSLVLGLDGNNVRVETITGEDNQVWQLESEHQVIDENTPLIIIDKTEAASGREASVKISLKNNPGITSMKLTVKYGAGLTLTGIEFNGDLGGMSQEPKSFDSPVILNWFNGKRDVGGDVLYATLKFALDEGLADGESIAVTAEYDHADVFDLDFNDVFFAVSEGSVTVKNYTPGDINDDGSVNNKDVVSLFKHLSGWDGEINMAAADVNRDGSINNKDVVYLFKYLSGWDVVLK